MIFDHAMAKYGWDPKAIYHASEVHDVADPGRWNYVTFNLSIFDYDSTTGQPQKYTGTVQSGNDMTYSFTISPDDDAVWDSNGVPPSDAIYVAETTTSTTTYKDRNIVIQMEDDIIVTTMESMGEAEDRVKAYAEVHSNAMGIVFFCGVMIVVLFVCGATVYLYCRNRNEKKRIMSPADYVPYHPL